MAGRRGGRLRRPGVIALAVLSMLGTAWASPAAQAATPAPRGRCSGSSGTLLVTLAADAARSSLTRRGAGFALNGVTCAASADVDSVTVADPWGHNADLRIVVPPKGFDSTTGEISWRVSLGDGVDSLTLRGRRGGNAIDVAGNEVNFNSDSSSSYDLVAEGVEGMVVSGGAGNDHLRSSATSGASRRAGTRSDGGISTSGASLGSYPTARMFGGAGNDTMNGDSRVNVISGGGGNDTLFGKGADDELQGGEGADTLYGADGDDLLNGGPGDDREFGGNNNDLFQQARQDTYTVNSPVSVPDVGQARSSLTVPSTDLNAVDVNVRVYIDHAATQDLWVTLISPAGGRVRLSERQGNGTPFDGTQFDSEANTNIRTAGSRNLSGRFHPEWSMELVQAANPTGEWTLLVEDKVSGSVGSIRGWELELGMPTAEADGSDSLSGGAGALDLVVYSQRTQPVTATLLGGADDGQELEADALGTTITCPATLPTGSQCADLEWAYTGSGDDTISGTDEVNDLRGAPGHDTITALDGADQLRGANGRDAISAGAGNDVIHGQGNADTIDGGAGFDRAMYGYAPVGMDIDISSPALGSASDGDSGNDDDVVSYIENITGTNQADRIIGANNLANVLLGGSGNDFLNGGSGIGNDNLDGAGGNDTCINGETTSGCETLTVPDSQPPTPPTGLAATVSPDYDVSLSWGAATDDVWVDRYAVYRDAVLLGYTSFEVFTDAGATPGATHQYTVTALDLSNNESVPSDPVDIVVDGQAPTAPTGLTAELNADEDVALAWQAPTDDIGVAGYAIYRDGGFLDNSAGESYVDQTALRGATYLYTVTALDAAGNESDPSEAVEITIGDVQPPTVPEGLTVQALSTRRLQLTWTAATDDSGAVTYDVYRGEDLIGSTTETKFVDASLAPGATATYSLRARDDAGNLSGFSTPTDGTTFPLLFEDDFGLGDLSRWTSQTRMSVSTPESSATGPAALAQSDGTGRSFATKALAGPQTTVYYRTKFRIDSQSTASNLLRLQTSTGTPIVTVFSSATRNLMIRNDVTASNVWSAKTLDVGVWYDLQLRASVAGASSEVEVWLDGVKIGSLSTTMQLGSNPVGQLMMGDNNLNRRYSIFFDDVAAAAGFID